MDTITARKDRALLDLIRKDREEFGLPQIDDVEWYSDVEEARKVKFPGPRQTVVGNNINSNTCHKGDSLTDCCRSVHVQMWLYMAAQAGLYLLSYNL